MAENKMQFPNFNIQWRFPAPNSEGGQTTYIYKTQDDFLREYYPSGHKIFSKDYYDDIDLPEKKIRLDPNTGKSIETIKIVKHPVARCAVMYQMEALTIYMAHAFGNKIQFDNVTPERTTEESKYSFTRYTEVADIKQFDTMVWDFFLEAEKCGHSAIHFYREDGKTKHRVYSFDKGDMLYCRKDRYGKPTTLFRKYKCTIEEDGADVEKEYIDVISKNGTITYEGDKVIDEATNTSDVVPFVYLKLEDGAFWTPAQLLIDDVELLLSRLAEDNKAKAKAKYVFTGVEIKEAKGKKTSGGFMGSKIGDTDVIMGGEGFDAKMIQGASLSEAFKFEYDTKKELVYNTLGITYAQQKSSGDMPTGSMKMVFFPTERKCKMKMHEYNATLVLLNETFKHFVTAEYPTYNFDKLEVMAWIKLFTPQDDLVQSQIINTGIANGSLAKSQGRAKYPLANRDNDEQCRQDEIEKAKLEAETNTTEEVVEETKEETIVTV